MKKKDEMASGKIPYSAGNKSTQKKHSTRRLNSNDTTPEIVVVGNMLRAQKIVSSLTELKVSVRCETWPINADALHPAALVVIAPVSSKKVTPAEAVRSLHGHGEWQALPIICIVPNNTADAKVQDIYAASASAVYKWPAEASTLAAMMAETIGINRAKGKANSGDSALARTIRAHLKTQRVYTSGLRVQVSNGTAHVSGAINALWKKDLVIKMIEQVAGISQVNSQGLFVPHSGISDKKVAQAIQHIISNVTMDDSMSISANVANGWVTLYGSIVDKREFQRVIEMLSHVRGVRGIKHQVTVGDFNRRRRQSRQLEEQMTELLKTTFPDSPVKLRTYHRTVVVSGQTDTLARRREIIETIEQLDDVDQVVNKLQIRT